MIETNLLLTNTGSERYNKVLRQVHKKAAAQKLKRVSGDFFFDALADFKKNHFNLNTLHNFHSGLKYGLKKILIRQNREDIFNAILPIFDQFQVSKPTRVFFQEDYLTMNQMAELLEIHSTPREACFLEAYAYSGARLGELLNVKLVHMTKKKNKWQILLKRTKTKKDRYVYLPDKLVKKIKSVFKSRTWLFETRYRTGYAKRTVSTAFERLSKKIGKRITPHLCRHWFANARAENATLRDLYALADYLGHTFITLVRHYINSKLKSSETYQPVKRRVDMARKAIRDKKKKKRA